MLKKIVLNGMVFLVIVSSSFHKVQATSEANLQLAVISDTHIDTKFQKTQRKLASALQDLNNIAPEYDVIAVNGDMTNYGLTEEYDLFNSIFQKNKNQNAQEFMAIGNHEWLEHQVNTSITDSELKNRFLTKMNVSNLYYDKWIKGYHFITIAGEKSENTMLIEYGEAERDSAYISDEQFKWLEDALSTNADPSKPIFVFFHQPIEDTVYGSEWSAGLDDKRILRLLKKYPQVILFTGHSHYPLDNPKSIVRDVITMVNTSSVAYTYTPEKEENYTQSQGYLVNVYDDKVEIKAREFSNGTWIRSVTILLPKSTTNQRAEPISYRNHQYNYLSLNYKTGWLQSNGKRYLLG